MQQRSASSLMRSTVGLVALIALALLAGMLLGGTLGSGFFAATPSPSPTPRAPRATPSPTPIDTAIVAAGVVVPARSADLVVATDGRVAQLLVEPDQEVAVDQLLLRLDSSRQQASVDLATADLRRSETAAEQARLELEDLPEDASEAEIQAAQLALRLAQAEVQVAQSELAEAQIALRETELRAPFAGTVVAVAVTEGEQARVGLPVMTIADLSGWLIETTDLGELDVVRIAIGDPAEITFDALPELQLRGTVARIQVRGTALEGGVRFGVLIRPAEHRTELRWNMSALVRLQPSS